MYYTVCEVARRLNLSPHTIRFYGKEGLLDFVDRDQNGNRIFKESDFEKLFIIASLKRSGMTIKQIKAFTVLCDEGDSTIARRLDIIKNQREAVEEQITELQDALDVLKYKTWLYETALEAGTTAVHDHMPPEEMPPHIRKIKDRIRKLTDDMETRYKEAAQNAVQEEKS
ncbi:MAG: MerR family transcriptional regulator [Eubacteriales bacterium]|nr:MerR family transcriptional regulator [Eubacteriales bacterium]